MLYTFHMLVGHLGSLWRKVCSGLLNFFKMYLFIISFIYLFMAMSLLLHNLFFSCGELGVVSRLLIAVASLVVEIGL